MAEPIEGYEILSEIHRGGQGIVYKALQKSTKRTVAIKVLPAGAYASPRQRHRFEREINLVASLRHPNIVTVYESGLTRERYYFAMEYIHGQPLDAYLSERDPPIDEVLRLMVMVCRAVAYAHQKGVIHRDLKPGNVLVDAEGQPHIVDFGLAKAAGTGLLDGQTPVTVTSEFMGTLAFASPEQVSGDPLLVDVRTDIYSLGVILHQSLTRHHPYDLSGDIAAVLARISRAEPSRPSAVRSELKGDLDTVILKALAKERDRRYQSAAELADDLERAARGEPIEARRDSLTYVLRKRGRLAIRKHPAVSLLIVVAATVVAVQHVGVPLFFRRTPVGPLFEQLVTVLRPSGAAQTAFEKVRIIALTDDTNAAALAGREGLEGVSPTNLTSLRRLHGRLMEKLVEAEVRAVVWGVFFQGETGFDQDLVKGIQALRDVGVPVIAGVLSWELDEEGLPALSRTIIPHVRWGCGSAGFSASASWRLHLVVRRGLADPMPSLALAAAASCRHPDAEVDYVLDDSAECLELRYWRPNPDVPRAKVWLDSQPDPIALSALRDAQGTELGLQPDDRLGYFVVDVPPDPALAESSITYHDALEADPQQLRRWLGGMVVFISDQRSIVPRYAYPDGRQVAGCYGYAAGIDALLRTVYIRYPGHVGQYGVIAGGALLGLLTALIAARQPLLRVGLLLGWTILIAIASLAAYWGFRYVCNPVGPVLALVVCCELSAAVNRARTIRR